MSDIVERLTTAPDVMQRPDGHAICLCADIRQEAANAIEALTTERDALQAELAAMTAVVQKWPKSADGVVLLPNMMLWDRNGDSVVVEYVSIGRGHLHPAHMGEEACAIGNYPDDTHGEAHSTDGRFRWWKCYSTREAAAQKR